MDDLAPLFQDIAFNERFRGYDVAEVDAYIDRVAKAAALVQGRIAELQRRAEAAEAHTAGSSGADPVEAGEESLTKMLLLAQRTADAAIDEAHAEAAEIRRQADDHASLVVAEAETDRRRMLAEAEAAVEESVRTERERVVAEVAELERYRAFLTDDITDPKRESCAIWPKDEWAPTLKIDCGLWTACSTDASSAIYDAACAAYTPPTDAIELAEATAAITAAAGDGAIYTAHGNPDCEICIETSIRRARTSAFISLVWAENFRAYCSRSFERPVWEGTFSNPSMNKAILMAQFL